MTLLLADGKEFSDVLRQAGQRLGPGRPREQHQGVAANAERLACCAMAGAYAPGSTVRDKCNGAVAGLLAIASRIRPGTGFRAIGRVGGLAMPRALWYEASVPAYQRVRGPVAQPDRATVS